MSSPRVRGQEERVFNRVSGALGRWLAKANEAVLGSARRLGLLPDPTAIYSVQMPWNDEVASLMPDLSAAAEIGWSEVNQQEVFSSNSSHVLGALVASQNLLRNIPNEVHQMIVQDIMAGLSKGESRQQIIDRIDLTLSMMGSERWTSRAATIATTETTRAANAGALAAAISAERSLGTMVKIWRDSSDHRVRETHQAVDGTELPLMQPFMVGGVPLMYPSEPMGPPEEVIGCRCDLTFRRAEP